MANLGPLKKSNGGSEMIATGKDVYANGLRMEDQGVGRGPPPLLPPSAIRTANFSSGKKNVASKLFRQKNKNWWKHFWVETVFHRKTFDQFFFEGNVFLPKNVWLKNFSAKTILMSIFDRKCFRSKKFSAENIFS